MNADDRTAHELGASILAHIPQDCRSALAELVRRSENDDRRTRPLVASARARGLPPEVKASQAAEARALLAAYEARHGRYGRCRGKAVQAIAKAKGWPVKRVRKYLAHSLGGAETPN